MYQILLVLDTKLTVIRLPFSTLPEEMSARTVSCVEHQNQRYELAKIKAFNLYFGILKNVFITF